MVFEQRNSTQHLTILNSEGNAGHHSIPWLELDCDGVRKHGISLMLDMVIGLRAGVRHVSPMLTHTVVPSYFPLTE